MAALFNKQYLMLWTLALSGMLFFAVLEGQGEQIHIEPLLFALDRIKEHLWQN